MTKTHRTLDGEPIALAVVCPKCYHSVSALVGDEWRRGDGVVMLAAEYGVETGDIWDALVWPAIPPSFECRRHGELSVDVPALRRAHARIGTSAGTVIVEATRIVKKPSGRSTGS